MYKRQTLHYTILQNQKLCDTHKILKRFFTLNKNIASLKETLDNNVEALNQKMEDKNKAMREELSRNVKEQIAGCKRVQLV